MKGFNVIFDLRHVLLRTAQRPPLGARQRPPAPPPPNLSAAHRPRPPTEPPAPLKLPLPLSLRPDHRASPSFLAPPFLCLLPLSHSSVSFLRLLPLSPSSVSLLHRPARAKVRIIPGGRTKVLGVVGYPRSTPAISSPISPTPDPPGAAWRRVARGAGCSQQRFPRDCSRRQD